MIEGDIAGAVAQLLRAFPDATRTPAESLVIARHLWEFDASLARALLSGAYAREPNEPKVLLDWAMDLHRQEKHQEALECYEKVVQLRPQWVDIHGLAADCLLRLGRIDESVAAWKRSWPPDRGMAVYLGHIRAKSWPYVRRAELLKKVRDAKDANSAMELIVLDCTATHGINSISVWIHHYTDSKDDYLTHDMKVIEEALGLPLSDPRMRAMKYITKMVSNACVWDPKECLRESGFLLDKDGSLPEHDGLRHWMCYLAIGKANPAKVRTSIGPRILDMARSRKSAEAWRALLASAPPDRVPARSMLIREAWQSTGDPAIAAIYLVHASSHLSWKPSAADEAAFRKDFDAIVKAFPQDGLVMGAAVDAAKRMKWLTKSFLIEATKVAMADPCSPGPLFGNLLELNNDASSILNWHECFEELVAVHAGKAPVSTSADRPRR